MELALPFGVKVMPCHSETTELTQIKRHRGGNLGGGEKDR